MLAAAVTRVCTYACYGDVMIPIPISEGFALAQSVTSGKGTRRRAEDSNNINLRTVTLLRLCAAVLIQRYRVAAPLSRESAFAIDGHSFCVRRCERCDRSTGVTGSTWMLAAGMRMAPPHSKLSAMAGDGFCLVRKYRRGWREDLAA